jgi:transcription antitermination factor NusG
MEKHGFKLGDKVVIRSGPHEGREGHIIGITQNGPRTDPSVTVRLYATPNQEAVVTTGDLRKL